MRGGVVSTNGLGIAVSGGAGGFCPGSLRLQPGVWGSGGGGQTCGKVEALRNPAVRGQVGDGGGEIELGGGIVTPEVAGLAQTQLHQPDQGRCSTAWRR